MSLATRSISWRPVAALLSGRVRPWSLGALALVVGACGAALGVSLLASPIYADDTVASVVFLAAVGLAGWYGGLGPALLATAFGVLAIDYFFETPWGLFEVTSENTVSDLLSFLVVALLTGALNARLRRSDSRLRAERDHARAALDDLMVAVSHEIRTPLTTIKTSVYSLRGRVWLLPPDTRESLLSNIETEADRLAHFVGEALALRQLENGVVPHWEWSEPGEVASAVLDRFLPLLGGRPVSFIFAEGLPSVRIDASLLDQALSALLQNAAVHTPPGTPITIEGGISGRDLRLSVSDAGPGVPLELRERIFAKYQRLNESTPGIGLGLALARAAAEAQGGRLWVEESPQGGARFVLVVPNAAAQVRATAGTAN